VQRSDIKDWLSVAAEYTDALEVMAYDGDAA